MQSQRTAWGWAVVIEPGEEIIATLRAWLERERIRAGVISGIGAVGDPELGFFIRTTKTYVRRAFPGEWEIGALTGNVSELEGAPFPHCHVVLGSPEFEAFTGHLFSGTVTVTCEMMILTDPGVLTRRTRKDLGFNPLELGTRA